MKIHTRLTRTAYIQLGYQRNSILFAQPEPYLTYNGPFDKKTASCCSLSQQDMTPVSGALPLLRDTFELTDVIFATRIATFDQMFAPL